MKKTCYILLGKNKETNEFVGEIEHSFSLGFDNSRVRVYRASEISSKKDLNKKETAYRWLKSNSDKYSEKYPQYDWRVYRAGSKNCPVKIDWREIISMRHRIMPHSKFNTRNLPFKLK